MTLLLTGFILIILSLLALDLGLFNRKPREISFKESLGWTACWVTLSLAFSIAVYFIYENHWFNMGRGPDGAVVDGWTAAMQYLTGYIVEESLSLDNIFVITLIFSYFAVPPQFQHRVLFYGILGALIMRGVMIGVGAALIHQFHWIIYVFGVMLVYTAFKLLMTSADDSVHPEKNPLVRLARRIYPVTSHFEGERFFTRMNGKFAVTPLFLVLLVVESTDLLFAIDSIPAIFAITKDPFIVFTSNIFAILGLRSLYFVLASVVKQFKYLKVSLSLLLAFIGVKMLLSSYYPIPIQVSLGVIITTLAGGIIASLLFAPRASERDMLEAQEDSVADPLKVGGRA
ncbi:MAG: TerC family protein [Phycisphaerae bacterium]|nr:TerC family protein [Phycisphaerae bacterium]